MIYAAILNFTLPVFSATMNIRKHLTSIFHGTFAVTYEPTAPAAVLNTALLCIKNGYSIPKRELFEKKKSINIRIEFYLFVSYSVMKNRGSTCKFRKALRALRNLHVDPKSCLSYHHEQQTRRIQALSKSLDLSVSLLTKTLLLMFCPSKKKMLFLTSITPFNKSGVLGHRSRRLTMPNFRPSILWITAKLLYYKLQMILK